MKILSSLILVTLSIFASSSVARVENDIFIKVKLQHVEFQNLLVERRYQQRRFVSSIISMNENFNPNRIEDIEKLKGEYSNLLNFKDYMHSIVKKSSVANRIDEIFETDYTGKINEYSKQLAMDIKTERLVEANSNKVQIREVEVVSKWVHFFGVIIGFLFFVGVTSYFSLKEKLEANIRKLRQLRFKEKIKVKAYKLSKEKTFYITKGKKVVYNSSRSKQLPNIKRTSDIEEEFFNREEFEQLKSSAMALVNIGDKFYRKCKINNYIVYDIVTQKMTQTNLHNFQVDSVQSKKTTLVNVYQVLNDIILNLEGDEINQVLCCTDTPFIHGVGLEVYGMFSKLLVSLYEKSDDVKIALEKDNEKLRASFMLSYDDEDGTFNLLDVKTKDLLHRLEADYKKYDTEITTCKVYKDSKVIGYSLNLCISTGMKNISTSRHHSRESHTA